MPTYSRLNLRVTSELHGLIEKAAALSGLSVQNYIRAVLSEESVRTIERHRIIKIAEEDAEAFMKVMEGQSIEPEDTIAGIMSQPTTRDSLYGFSP